MCFGRHGISSKRSSNDFDHGIVLMTLCVSGKEIIPSDPSLETIFHAEW